jgi:hypothetical protein
MAGLMTVNRNHHGKVGASVWEFSFRDISASFNIILVHFNIHRLYPVVPQGGENMSAATILKNHPTEAPDKQTKVMDHTASDVGSIPARSQAVVLAPSTSSSRTSLTRIVTAISLAALLVPAIYLRSFFQPTECPINPTDHVTQTKRALSQTPLIDRLPFVLTGCREKFAGPAGPHQFSVKANGKHAGLDTQPSSQRVKLSVRTKERNINKL